MTRKKKVHGIICPKCDEFVWSRHRHDFRTCGCGYCFVDGGQNDYVRIGFGHNEATGHTWPEDEQIPPRGDEREISLTEEDEQMLAYQPRWPY